jgi:WD40 repeat protein
MGEHSRLDELLSLWEQQLVRGCDVPAAELCRDQPELLTELQRRIDHLRQLGKLAQHVNSPHSLVTLSPQPAPAADPGQTVDAHLGVVSDLSAGAAPPGYELLSELGRGGMGVVYKARHIQLDRVVALKMILAGGHASASESARFKDEAKAIARLQHPNIVQVHDVGEQGGLPYFSLEYCPGGSLDKKLAGTPLPSKEAAVLVEALAKAMHAAHEKGVVHRDLKPANVLLSADGTAKVTDFGLAKKLDEEGRTATGAVMGTPSYMAPEQAGGHGKRVGPAADVYALGAILYECLTGRPPFRAATTLDTILQVVSEEPASVRQLQPGVAADLETICHRCLQKEPARRYASALELAEDLRRFQAGEPIRARPTGWLERGVRWARKNPGRATALSAVFFVVGFVMVFQAIANRRERERAEELRQANETTRAALTEAEQARDQEKEARRQAVAAGEAARRDRESKVDQLYATSIDLAYREWQQNNVYRTEQLLNECPAALRGWEWDYLKGLCRPERMTLQGHMEGVDRVVVSPDGVHLASTDGNATLCWDLATGREIRTYPGGDPAAFGPDGRRLALGFNRVVKVYDESEGRELLVLPEGKGRVMAVAFADEGRQLLTVTVEDQTLHRWDAATGRKLGTVSVTPLYSNSSTVVFSPDGTHLAAGADDGQVRVWNSATGVQRHHFTSVPLMHVTQIAFSPRGDRLAAAWAEGTVMLWELGTGKELRRWRAHRSAVSCLGFSPDGKRLATGSQDTSIRLWDLVTFEEALTLRGHTSTVRSLAFTPNGKDMLSASDDRSLKVWDLDNRRFFSRLYSNGVLNLARVFIGETGSPAMSLPPGNPGYRTFYGHRNPSRSVVFSPNSRFVATAGNGDPFVVVWDLATNKVRDVLGIHGGGAWAATVLAFSPDGSCLAGFNPARGFFPAELKLWELSNGKVLLDRQVLSGDPVGLVFLPGGEQAVAAFATDRSTRLCWWEFPSGKEVGTLDLNGERVHSLSLSADGRQLVAGSAEKVLVIDAGARKVEHSFTVPEMTVLALSRDNVVATGNKDLLIRLFDLATGKEAHKPLEGHTGLVAALAFHPKDGRRLVSAGKEQAVKVWNVATGRELLTFREHLREVERVAWSPDGRKLASVSWDHTLKVWEAPGDPAQVTDRWPVLFTDRFDRATLSAAWQVFGGSWSIENGALRGVLADSPKRKLPLAQLHLIGKLLPEIVEVRYECWAPQPLICNVLLVDPATGNILAPLLAGVPHQFKGLTGAFLLLLRSAGTQAKLIGVPRRDFNFVPGRHYQVRVLRERTRLTLTVDGETLFSEPIPVGPAPILCLQGSWGRVGGVVYFANLEIRAPRSAGL